mmetsp:Transcript_49682/g.106150  ORF Transcript_49682/g.106150 Transcript_49682/m.106150 type:complete len:245 (-) Transcript_49682:529-1263(-)
MHARDADLDDMSSLFGGDEVLDQPHLWVEQDGPDVDLVPGGERRGDLLRDGQPAPAARPRHSALERRAARLGVLPPAQQQRRTDVLAGGGGTLVVHRAAPAGERQPRLARRPPHMAVDSAILVKQPILASTCRRGCVCGVRMRARLQMRVCGCAWTASPSTPKHVARRPCVASRHAHTCPTPSNAHNPCMPRPANVAAAGGWRSSTPTHERRSWSGSVRAGRGGRPVRTTSSSSSAHARRTRSP